MPIEKIWEPEYKRPVCNDDGSQKFDEHGKPMEETVRPWRIEATGKEVNELRGTFKDTAPQMLHESAKEWEARGGSVKITKPNGEVDDVRADLLDRYRAKPGFCKTRIRPGITVSGFGGMRKRGISRYRAVYSKGTVTVLEER